LDDYFFPSPLFVSCPECFRAFFLPAIIAIAVVVECLTKALNNPVLNSNDIYKKLSIPIATYLGKKKKA